MRNQSSSNDGFLLRSSILNNLIMGRLRQFWLPFLLIGALFAFYSFKSGGDANDFSDFENETRQFGGGKPTDPSAPFLESTTPSSAPPSSHRLQVIESLYGVGPSFENRDWLDHLNLLDDDRLAPLTKEAQRYIYSKLHPDPNTCSRQKYLVGHHTPSQGLGSLLHVTSYLVAAALQHNRLLVWSPSAGSDFVDKSCGPNGETNFDCIFEPISSCSHKHVTKRNSLDADPFNPTPGAAWNTSDPPTFLANKLRALYPEKELSVPGIKAWWRAQGAAYAARLNKKSLAIVRAMRFNSTLHHGLHIYSNGTRLNLKLPFPLPPRTASAHVRHGDKGSEMSLVPFSGYMEKLELFVNHNPVGWKKSVFISSENPKVIEDATNVTKFLNTVSPDGSWTVYFSQIPRINAGPMEQLAANPRTMLTMSWMLQLFMAIECDMWAGTRGSNWNRLIDEVRCVWVDKCDLPFFEVGTVKDWSETFGGYWW